MSHSRLCKLSCVLLVLLLGRSDAAESDLDEMLAELLGRLPAPGWMDNYVAQGVLHDHGIVMWEMPETYQRDGRSTAVAGGGYNAALRSMQRDASYFRSLLPNPPSEAAMTPEDVARLHAIVFSQDYSRLDLSDIENIYTAGTSVALQNLVFAPYRPTPDSPFTFYKYPEFADIQQRVAAAGLRLYGNIGLQNNRLFWDNEWEFKVRHGQKMKAPCPFWATSYFDQEKLRASGIDRHVYLWPRPSSRLEGLETERVYPQPVLDVTDPEVIRMAQESIRQLVDSWWDKMGFFVGGEFGTGVMIDGVPVTDFSPGRIAAFRQYLAKFVGDYATVNQRWGLDNQDPHRLRSLDGITPAHVEPAVSSQAVADFRAFQRHLTGEVNLLQYATAKSQQPQGLYGSLEFGREGMERSGLLSDFPATGDWYGHDQDRYFQRFGDPLRSIADAARLVGRPAAFAITSPLTATPPPDYAPEPEPNRPPVFAKRYFSREHFDLFLGEILTAGIVHFGYYKAPGGWSTFGSASVQTMMDVLRSIKKAQSNRLRFMTPSHCVNIHLDPVQMQGFLGKDSVARRIAAFLADEHVRYAIFSDQRVFERLYSRERLKRGVLVSPFHSQLDVELMQKYVKVAEQSTHDPVILVLTDFETCRKVTGRPPTPISDTCGILRWDPNYSLFVLVFADNDPTTCQQGLDLILPKLLHAMPESDLRPIEVSSDEPAGGNISANYVTDGLNYLVVVSNRSRTETYKNVTIRVQPRLLSQLDGPVSGYRLAGGDSFHLGPKATRVVYAAAKLSQLDQISAADLRRKARQCRVQLDGLRRNGFEVAHGQELITYIKAIDTDRYKERVIAGLARLQNVIFLKAVRNQATITLQCARLDGSPVKGAAVQVLHLLAGHEEQEAGMTDAKTGTAVVTIGPVSSQHWDFFSERYQAPSVSPGTEPVEVHVHDPITSAHAFVTVP